MGYQRVSLIKRVWIDILILAAMLGLSFLLPSNQYEASQAGSKLNLLAIFISKTNSVILPLMIVDLLRRWKWPYLDLHVMLNDRNWAGVMFLAIIYAVVVYSYAVGG